MSEEIPKFTLRLAEDIPSRLRDIYDGAHKRRLLQAMAVSVDEATLPVFETLEDEKTLFLPDRYSYYFSDDAWRYSIHSERRRRARKNAQAVFERTARIESVGGQARMIHHPQGVLRRPLQIAGRNHMKVYAADNTVLSFGGVNFTKGSFEHHDYLIETTDRQIADILFDHAERLYRDGRIATTSSEHGVIHYIDNENQILIDYGRPNKSVIYEAAIELTLAANEGVMFVSQHRPGGKLEFALAEKLEELGPDRVEIIFNHHTAFKGTGRLQQFIESWTPFVSEMHPESGYVHAKFIIAYFADGSRIALTGSHNFHEGGVRLGTSEIALKTSDSQLIDQLERFAGTIPT